MATDPYRVRTPVLNAKVKEVDTQAEENTNLLTQILKELQIMNFHLSSMTGIENDIME
jgi:hypothetical protein